MTTLTKPQLQDSLLVYQSDFTRYEQAYSLNNFEFLDSIELSDIIAVVLTEILKKTDKSPNVSLSVFHSKHVPRISIQSYLSRLIENFKCSQECLILAMIYMDRLTTSRPRFVIRSTNVHRYLMFHKDY